MQQGREEYVKEYKVNSGGIGKEYRVNAGR
jgi:hypothetical protein